MLPIFEFVRPNVLAFSCEAARAILECSQNIARLRQLQRPVRRQNCEPISINTTNGATSVPAIDSTITRILFIRLRLDDRRLCSRRVI